MSGNVISSFIHSFKHFRNKNSGSKINLGISTPLPLWPPQLPNTGFPSLLPEVRTQCFPYLSCTPHPVFPVLSHSQCVVHRPAASVLTGYLLEKQKFSPTPDPLNQKL